MRREYARKQYRDEALVFLEYLRILYSASTHNILASVFTR